MYSMCSISVNDLCLYILQIGSLTLSVSQILLMRSNGEMLTIIHNKIYWNLKEENNLNEIELWAFNMYDL